jgi:DNA (cytosine-5)-methyltransferase 1
VTTKAISLFSGCGGSDLALQGLGIDVVWANDIWDTACKTYSDNLPSAQIHCGDIQDVSTFPSADLLVGCYPCQGFTQGGKRDWGASINYLYKQFDRVLRIVRPAAFVVENVGGMAYGANRILLENQLVRYRLAGYKVRWSILEAQNYGVAQMRKRVFIVGVSSDLDFDYSFPKPTHGPGLKPHKSQKSTLKGLPEWPIGEFNDEPFHWYYMSRNRRHAWEEPSPCIVGHWRHVPLHPASPQLTRISTDEWVFSDDGPARRLAYRECAALQGFPKRALWLRGSVRDKFQMIGNAVPPPLFKAVTKNLGPVLKEVSI